jgi:hypothetical protein
MRGRDTVTDEECQFSITDTWSQVWRDEKASVEDGRPQDVELARKLVEVVSLKST